MTPVRPIRFPNSRLIPLLVCCRVLFTLLGTTMPSLKTHCPKCDAALRLTVEEDGEREVDRPKCGHACTANNNAYAPPKTANAKKAVKTSMPEKGTKESAAKNGKPTRRHDDDDDDDDTPKKKKKKGAETKS